MSYDREIRFSASRSFLKVGTVALAFCFATVAGSAAQAPPPPVGSMQQGASQDQAPPPPQQQAQQQAQQNAPVPGTITLQAGTLIGVRTTGFLSSDQNKTGDTFNAVEDQPLIADGWVVSRRGQVLTGRIAEAEKAGRVTGVSHLGLELTDLTLVDGQHVAVKTELIQNTGGTSRGRDAVAIGTTTGVGAAIGAAAAGGEGAGIGAGAGAVAGIAGVLLTRGRPTVVYPESLLMFRLKEPVTISTGNGQAAGQAAYQQVTPDDYGSAVPDQTRQMGYGYGAPGAPVGYPPPPPYGYYYPYPYPYPYYGYGYGFYPGPFFGFYGGPRFGFRGGFGGRFRR